MPVFTPFWGGDLCSPFLVVGRGSDIVVNIDGGVMGEALSLLCDLSLQCYSGEELFYTPLLT